MSQGHARVLTFTALAALSFALAPTASAVTPRVAIYSDIGVFEDCVVASEAAWASMGAETERVNAIDIIGGYLADFHVLEVPGGWAQDYKTSLGSDGISAIKTFVSQGGGYLGIGAGGFLASARVTWQGRPFRYNLDLLNVTAAGPLSNIAPWPSYAMTGVDYQSHAITTGLPDPSQVMYYGGAAFTPLRRTDATVIATYTHPDYSGQGEAVVGTYSAGRVALIGTQPEFEEGSAADGVTGWEDTLVDPESDWPFLRQTLEWLLKQR